MNRAAQALADALAGNVRLWVSSEAYTQAHVRNLLLKAGVPVIWETGNIRVKRGTLTSRPRATDDDVIEILWEPKPACDHRNTRSITQDANRNVFECTLSVLAALLLGVLGAGIALAIALA